MSDFKDLIWDVLSDAQGNPWQLKYWPNKLVKLYLRFSNLKQLWKGTKIDAPIGLLRKLTCLNLKGCKSIIKLPHFGEGLNLETLNMEGCTQLKHIDPSIGFLRNLTYLVWTDCKSIVKLPHFGEGLNVKKLEMRGCTQLKQVDPSIDHLKKLTLLDLTNCKNLVSLPNTILSFDSLESLRLSESSKLYITPSLQNELSLFTCQCLPVRI
ncbi:hypothetical protein VNO78_06471 [Psophocarpus tetragonolobus]|uniref:Disease resistance protein At4g27190-like leucine-rich repeats domain-containing protein n=1 Tax=Psophocarpus tetragonolobus TaxID=3891 RepID=A0AAN9SUB4_PSOTE